MAVLALSFSAEVGSVALVHSAGFVARESARKVAGATPGMMVREVLQESGAPSPLAVAVALGPGSYTGVRMAVSFAKSFALVRGIPLFACTDHAAIAALYAQDGEEVLVRHQGHGVRDYWSRYRGAATWPTCLSAESLGVAPPADGLRVLGDRGSHHVNVQVHARDLGGLALCGRMPRAELLLVEPTLPQAV
jgi:tRNA threonylcarbamoyl adenosine modification protein YeaZ